MLLKPYRETLALPGIKSLLAVATLARIPIAAGAVVLTLHVVTDLDRGYGAAGLAGAALTIGGSAGAPVMGRLIDRRGLRPVLLLTTVAEVIFWTAAQAVPYWLLLILALLGGFLALPAFSVARQSIAALTPEAQRLPAFALDSITTELSFMAGPALGVLIATTAGARPAMLTMAAGILLAGAGLWWLNPPVRADHEPPVAAGERVPRRDWLRPRFIAVLAVTMAATLVLAGTDVTLVAVLRANDELSWAGVVMALWAFYSLLGGFAYGTVRRRLPAVFLFAPMAVLTVLVAAGHHHWWLMALLLIPCGALCAPTITASADAASRMTPAAARGEAMGLHNSALTVGVALGGPLAGLAADTLSPPWGFAAVGGVGILIALVVLPLELRRRPTGETPPPPAVTDRPATTPAPPGHPAPATAAPLDRNTTPPQAPPGRPAPGALDRNHTSQAPADRAAPVPPEAPPCQRSGRRGLPRKRCKWHRGGPRTARSAPSVQGRQGARRTVPDEVLSDGPWFSLWADSRNGSGGDLVTARWNPVYGGLAASTTLSARTLGCHGGGPVTHGAGLPWPRWCPIAVTWPLTARGWTAGLPWPRWCPIAVTWPLTAREWTAGLPGPRWCPVPVAWPLTVRG